MTRSGKKPKYEDFDEDFSAEPEAHYSKSDSDEDFMPLSKRKRKSNLVRSGPKKNDKFQGGVQITIGESPLDRNSTSGFRGKSFLSKNLIDDESAPLSSVKRNKGVSKGRSEEHFRRGFKGSEITVKQIQNYATTKPSNLQKGHVRYHTIQTIRSW